MPHSAGDLTILNWLYHGNYPAWEKRTNLQLQYTFENAEAELSYYEDKDGTKPDIEAPADAVWDCLEQILDNDVHDSLTDCIPDYDISKPWLALGLLRKFATPFRFLELPAVVRKDVYGYYFLDHGNHCEHEGEYIIDPDGSMYEALPEMLGVSHAVRAEAVPLFFAEYGHFRLLSGDNNPVRLADAIRHFGRVVLRENVHRLTHLALDVNDDRFEIPSAFTIFRWDAHRGLQIEMTDQCFPRAERKGAGEPFEALVREVEKDRIAFGGRGEAILQAITRRPELWERTYDLDEVEMAT